MFVKTPLITKYFYPSLVWKKDTDQKKIWITFDDGPDKKVTPYVVNVLEKFNIKATFFVIGNQAKIVTWYDNEVGFSNRVIDLANFVGSKL